MIPVVVMAAFGLIAVLVVRRREAAAAPIWPDRHTWAALTVCVAVVVSSASILLVGGAESTAGRAIHLLVLYATFGCAVPGAYTLFVERRSPRDLGIRRDGAVRALAVNLGMGAVLGMGLAFGGDFERANGRDLAAASFTLLVGGLFELYLAGWVLMLGIPVVCYAVWRRRLSPPAGGRRSASPPRRAGAG